MSGKRNRTAGHNWERKCVQILKSIFPNAITSRMESKSMDDAGVDICNTPGFYFQCKNTNRKLDYSKLINNMPKTDNKRIILHKLTKKSPSGRFVKQGNYVIMLMDDFLSLLKEESK